MKLLVRIKEKIEIVYITIVFVSVLVGFVVAVILAHVIWALAPGVGAFHSNSQNSYMGAYPGVGACSGQYGMYIHHTFIIGCLLFSSFIWFDQLKETCLVKVIFSVDLHVVLQFIQLK